MRREAERRGSLLSDLSLLRGMAESVRRPGHARSLSRGTGSRRPSGMCCRFRLVRQQSGSGPTADADPTRRLRDHGAGDPAGRGSAGAGEATEGFDSYRDFGACRSLTAVGQRLGESGGLPTRDRIPERPRAGSRGSPGGGVWLHRMLDEEPGGGMPPARVVDGASRPQVGSPVPGVCARASLTPS
jgi:hypothetical protein